MSRELAITTIMMLLSMMQPAHAGDHKSGIATHSGSASMVSDTGDDHSGQENTNGAMKGEKYLHVEGMTGLLFKQKVVDGYLLTFHVMKVDDREAIGCKYRLMFKAEMNGFPVQNLIVNSRVIHPNQQSESKIMTKMGDWYAAAYDLTHPGKHELRVLFKARASSMHGAGVTYTVVARNRHVGA